MGASGSSSWGSLVGSASQPFALTAKQEEVRSLTLRSFYMSRSCNHDATGRLTELRTEPNSSSSLNGTCYVISYSSDHDTCSSLADDASAARTDREIHASTTCIDDSYATYLCAHTIVYVRTYRIFLKMGCTPHMPVHRNRSNYGAV